MAESVNTSDSQFRPPWMEVSPVENAASETPPDAGQTGSKTDQPSETAPATDFATSDLVEPSPFRKIIPFLVILIVLVLLAFVIKNILNKKEGGFQLLPTNKAKEITLTYWGLWESKEVMAPLIDAYKKEHPEVTIDYVFQSSKDYRERLQSTLAAGKGPDIFRFHATWLPMFINQNQLAAAPENLFNWSDYYPVMETLKVKGQAYAVPLGFDALALFYNADIFKAAGVAPPTTWEELRSAATKLTVRDNSGNLQTGGIALGTTNNIDNWSDIVALMMLQNGADLANPTDKFAEDALKFYTIFSKVYRVWDSSLPSSTYAFATGRVAMIIAPSWRAFEISETNSKLNFKTVEVPQLTKDSSAKVTWATFWVEGVAKSSTNSQAAWEFLKFLSKPENLKKLYANESQIRLFGEPYPLKSLAKDLETHPLAAPFVTQGPYAKIWYLCSRTNDNGINDRMIKYYEDAVNSVLGGGSAQTALAQAATGIKQVLNQYGLLTPTASP